MRHTDSEVVKVFIQQLATVQWSHGHNDNSTTKFVLHHQPMINTQWAKTTAHQTHDINVQGVVGSLITGLLQIY